MITAPARDFFAAALKRQHNEDSTLEFCATGGAGNWSVFTHLDKTFASYTSVWLSSTRTAGEPREFKTLDAAQQFIKRLCDEHNRRGVLSVHW